MGGLPPDGHALGLPARPSTARGRWRGRLESLRIKWRRLTGALVIGVGVGLVALAVLQQIDGPGDAPRSPGPPLDLALSTGAANGEMAVPNGAESDGPESDRAGSDGDRTAIDGEQRVMAVDLDSTPLPLQAGDRVELIGLSPTVTAMEAIVIAADAEVVAVTSDAVLLLVTADQALQASEIQAIGALTVFGLARPANS